FAVSTLFTLLCAYLLLRAMLDLKGDEGGPQLAWPWAAWLCANALFWLCCEPFTIPNDSMRQTLLSGDYLLVEKASLRLGRAPRRGDLVVFHYPVDPKQVFVKRVVGVPGDRLRIADKQLFRNGAAVAEPYAIHATSYQDPYRDNFPSAPLSPLPQPGLDMLNANVQGGEVIVPAGRYFVMGDNRDDSLDSRYWGFVSAGEIIGRPLLIYASYDLESGESKTMATAFNTRWDRLLKPL
ncbi:MAG TPA: signal peptidase I, partial [Candidatus Sulfopaludibacter sp.]|nr:signal peptidase I [Candidatus Sulfopaludibacter sp.]